MHFTNEIEKRNRTARSLAATETYFLSDHYKNFYAFQILATELRAGKVTKNAFILLKP